MTLREAFPDRPGPLLGLTLRQPWATAVAWWGKRIENRGQRPPGRLQSSPLAIHAGLTFRSDEAIAATHLANELQHAGIDVPLGGDRYPVGAIVAVCKVVGFVDDRLGDQCAVGLGDGVSPVDVLEDPWWAGPVGWLLLDVYPLDRPVVCRGAQGVWPVAREVRADVELRMPAMPLAPTDLRQGPSFAPCSACMGFRKAGGGACGACAGLGRELVTEEAA